MLPVAIGAGAMLHTRSYASGDDMEHDGNAHTITSTYHDGRLIHPVMDGSLAIYREDGCEASFVMFVMLVYSRDLW